MDQIVGNARRMRSHRDYRRQLGYRETVVWLHGQMLDQLDQLVDAGKYANRSEAVAVAMQEFLNRKT